MQTSVSRSNIEKIPQKKVVIWSYFSHSLNSSSCCCRACIALHLTERVVEYAHTPFIRSVFSLFFSLSHTHVWVVSNLTQMHLCFTVEWWKNMKDRKKMMVWHIGLRQEKGNKSTNFRWKICPYEHCYEPITSKAFQNREPTQQKGQIKANRVDIQTSKCIELYRERQMCEKRNDDDEDLWRRHTHTLTHQT